VKLSCLCGQVRIEILKRPDFINECKMACTHTAAMAVLSRIGGAHGGDRHVALMAAAASRLLKSFAIQVETLRRLRAGGSQFMRIEHVHIEANAQAVIGNVQNTGGGQ
jgi:hypothetical protein